MVALKLQKRLAASVLDCGRRKVWLDPNEVNEISMANSSKPPQTLASFKRHTYQQTGRPVRPSYARILRPHSCCSCPLSCIMAILKDEAHPRNPSGVHLCSGHGICAIAMLSDMSCAGCRAKHPQACEGRLCHQEAHSHPLTSSRSSLSRGQEQGSSHWLWYARGLRTSLCLEFFLSASRSAALLLSGPSPLHPQLRPDVQFTMKLVANSSSFHVDGGVGRIACSIIVMQCLPS